LYYRFGMGQEFYDDLDLAAGTRDLARSTRELVRRSKEEVAETAPLLESSADCIVLSRERLRRADQVMSDLSQFLG